MDTTQADAYAAERNYTDWTAKGTPEKTAALLRASDYITARYPLRVTLTDAEQARLDAAQFLIARDLLLNSKPLSIREEARVLKESKEGAGFKKETEYTLHKTKDLEKIKGIENLPQTLPNKIKQTFERRIATPTKEDK